jgi:N-acetylglucosaminyldiphosphoundecaprenol N-acetyl-beta-D-mannosaminyltransferase
MTRSKRRPSARLLGTSVEALDMELALNRIAGELEARRKGYICMAGVHGIMEALRNPELAAIYAGSSMTVPDGTPTVWVGRWQGHKAMQRVAGPDLMLEVFRRKEFAGCTHFLYGGEEHVAEQLRERFSRRFPWARIVGTYTPPYRDLNAEEEQSLIARVRKLKPDIIWVGISTPRQERFMHRYLHRLDTTLMFGVGAAYDFHTGRIQDAPQWIKTIGMQWLHRLLQDPRRLWKRYFRNNPAFLWHIALQLSGMRQYPHTTLEYLPAPPVVADDPLHADGLVRPLATSRTQLQQLGS